MAAVTIVLLELLLRPFGLTHPILYSPDPVTGYRLQPNQAVRYLGNEIKINQWGLRDERPLTELAGEGMRRILVLGDSVTWGGIREQQSDIFTAVLERELADAQVLNAGVNGYSVAQMTGLYKAHLKELKPDLVVVYAIPRDFSRAQKVELTGRGVAFAKVRPKLALPVAFSLGRYAMFQRLGWDCLAPPPAAVEPGTPASEEENIRRNITAYQALHNDLAGHSLLVISPTQDDPYRASTLAALDEAGVSYVDLSQHAETTAESFVDQVHLSTLGHQQIGQALAEVVKSAYVPPMATVNAESTVYTYTPAENGSGPLWSYGCTVVARLDDEVVVSEMETGEGVPLLCNTRWRLHRRDVDGVWPVFAEAEGYRQREPAVLGTIGNGVVLLNVNDSTEPKGTKYGPCVPYVIRFDLNTPGPGRKLMPQWVGSPYFTDHSYRGFAVDRGRAELLMMNIDAKTSVQNWCHMSAEGEVFGKGQLTFPIRSCYQQVALKDGAAYVMAIGDIVEPVEAWRAYKFAQTQRKWDYVFRILHFAWTPDIRKEDFRTPIEVANVDATAGHISNQDLWVSPGGEVYLMYTERAVQNELMRDKFFPNLSLRPSLHLAIVKDGQVVRRRVLIEGTDEVEPGHARFQVTPGGRVFAVLFLGGKKPGNYLLQVYPEQAAAAPVPIPLEHPMGSYLLASERAGNAPSTTVDMFGYGSAGAMLHAEIEIE